MPPYPPGVYTVVYMPPYRTSLGTPPYVLYCRYQHLRWCIDG